MQPLFQALVGKPKKVQWAKKMISAFNLAKEVLSRATMLAHPHADAPTAITVDVSGVAVGAALEQLVNGLWQPLAFFSRQLRPCRVTDMLSLLSVLGRNCCHQSSTELDSD